jgi:hypothetical protein
MRYHRKTGCDGCVAISMCSPDGSWALSILRCVVLPGLTMWYYTFDFMPFKLECVAVGTHKMSISCVNMSSKCME